MEITQQCLRIDLNMTLKRNLMTANSEWAVLFVYVFVCFPFCPCFLTFLCLGELYVYLYISVYPLPVFFVKYL